MIKMTELTSRPLAVPVEPNTGRIHQVVQAAMRHWQLRQNLATAAKTEIDYPPLESVLQPIARRERLVNFDEHSDAFLPSYTALPHENDFGYSLGRLLTWIYLLVTVLFGVGLDLVMRRDSLARRAVH